MWQIQNMSVICFAIHSTSNSNKSVDVIVSIYLTLALSSNCLCNFLHLYTLKNFVTLFPLPSSEPTFVGSVLCMSSDHFVRQCFDTVGCALLIGPINRVLGGTLNPTHLVIVLPSSFCGGCCVLAFYLSPGRVS